MTEAKQEDSKGTGKKARPAWQKIAVVALVLGGAIWLWEEVLEYHVVPKRWGTVEEGTFYRSGQLSSTLVKRTLERHGIEVIVDLTHELPDDKYQQAELAAARELGIEHNRFPLRGDGTGDIGNFAKAVAKIVEAREQDKTVLLHCAAGVQRTGAVLAAYRVLVEGKSPEFAMKELRRNKWHPRDNPALLEHFNAHLGELAALLVEQGVIDEVPEPLPLLPAP